MIDPRHRHHLLPRHPASSGPLPRTDFKRRWSTVVDWLGAQKPLNLILGVVMLIAVVAVLAQMA